jgi:hypothetical protein
MARQSLASSGAPRPFGEGDSGSSPVASAVAPSRSSGAGSDSSVDLAGGADDMGVVGTTGTGVGVETECAAKGPIATGVGVGVPMGRLGVPA